MGCLLQCALEFGTAIACQSFSVRHEMGIHIGCTPIFLKAIFVENLRSKEHDFHIFVHTVKIMWIGNFIPTSKHEQEVQPVILD